MCSRKMLNVAILCCCLLPFISGQLTHDPKKMLNWCLDSKFHKKEPGPESSLFQQCTPWAKKSCCTSNVTEALHDDVNHYNLNFNHCKKQKNLSSNCKRHFVQDLCFFECSPNIGPWVVKIDGMKTRKQRFYQVPLCRSDCETWYNACEDDYTCSDNWMRNFIWDKNGNHCIEGAECLTFKNMFQNSTNFCEKVWDHSWVVVDDSQPCMKLWFNGTNGNPNDKVAQLKMEELLYSRKDARNLEKAENNALRVKFPVVVYIAVLFFIVQFFT